MLIGLGDDVRMKKLIIPLFLLAVSAVSAPFPVMQDAGTVVTPGTVTFPSLDALAIGANTVNRVVEGLAGKSVSVSSIAASGTALSGDALSAGGALTISSGGSEMLALLPGGGTVSVTGSMLISGNYQTAGGASLGDTGITSTGDFTIYSGSGGEVFLSPDQGSGEGEVVVTGTLRSDRLQMILAVMSATGTPSDPADGFARVWMSDGTGGYGEAGDICVVIHSGASTKYATLVDFSALP